MLAAVLSKALRRVSRRKGSWPEKSFFCLKQAEIQVGRHKLLEPSSYCRSPGLKSPPKSRSASKPGVSAFQVLHCSPVSQLLPLKPGGHLQVNLPAPLRQVAPF